MELKNLSMALVKAQASMHAASKDSKNPHFKSTYSSLAAVIDAVRETLAINGLCFVQKLHTANDGVSVETIIIHESGEQLSCGILFVPASKYDAQGYGSALTYAKRYSLQSALGVSSEDDDGEAARKAPKAPAFDFEAARSAIVACGDMATLKEVFAKVYKAAPSAMQREAVKSVYEAVKLELTTVTPTQGE